MEVWTRKKEEAAHGKIMGCWSGVGEGKSGTEQLQVERAGEVK